MLKYRNKWSVMEDIPMGELLSGRVRSIEGEELFHSPCPHPAWVLSSPLALCLQIDHNKWHEVCSMPKDSNITKVVELPFTACWDLQGGNSHQARSRHAEPWGVQSERVSVCGRPERVEEKHREIHDFCHGYFCSGESPLELVLEELWQCDFPDRKGIAFPIEMFHKQSLV